MLVRLSGAKPESPANLYEIVDLRVCYDQAANAADVSIIRCSLRPKRIRVGPHAVQVYADSAY